MTVYSAIATFKESRNESKITPYALYLITLQWKTIIF